LKDNLNTANNRLFLFAFYSNAGLLGKATYLYLRSLSQAGDVVFYADCEMKDGELDKIKNITIHAGALRHGEYDFGSYKRGWEWVNEHDGIQSYDYVYLVNDSVFCTVHDLVPFLERLERGGNDFTGMVFNPNHRGPHIQSWFVGFSRNIFFGPAFDCFLRRVNPEGDKNQVCIKYETGLSSLALSMGYEPHSLLTIGGKGIYNNVRKNLSKGLPFIKKSSFIRHDSSLSAQINRALPAIQEDIVNSIFDEIRQEYGREIYENCRTTSRMTCAFRSIRYSFHKLIRSGK